MEKQRREICTHVSRRACCGPVDFGDWPLVTSPLSPETRAAAGGGESVFLALVPAGRDLPCTGRSSLQHHRHLRPPHASPVKTARGGTGAGGGVLSQETQARRSGSVFNSFFHIPAPCPVNPVSEPWTRNHFGHGTNKPGFFPECPRPRGCSAFITGWCSAVR